MKGCTLAIAGPYEAGAEPVRLRGSELSGVSIGSDDLALTHPRFLYLKIILG